MSVTGGGRRSGQGSLFQHSLTRLVSPTSSQRFINHRHSMPPTRLTRINGRMQVHNSPSPVLRSQGPPCSPSPCCCTVVPVLSDGRLVAVLACRLLIISCCQPATCLDAVPGCCPWPWLEAGISGSPFRWQTRLCSLPTPDDFRVPFFASRGQACYACRC
jgi:hypothetical protein